MNTNAEMTPDREELMRKHTKVWMVLYDKGMRDENLMGLIERKLWNYGYHNIKANGDWITIDVIVGVAMSIQKYNLNE